MPPLSTPQVNVSYCYRVGMAALRALLDPQRCPSITHVDASFCYHVDPQVGPAAARASCRHGEGVGAGEGSCLV
jgi:hypothetical protein